MQLSNEGIWEKNKSSQIEEIKEKGNVELPSSILKYINSLKVLQKIKIWILD